MGWLIRPGETGDIPAIVGLLNAVLPAAEQVTEASLR